MRSNVFQISAPELWLCRRPQGHKITSLDSCVPVNSPGQNVSAMSSKSDVLAPSKLRILLADGSLAQYPQGGGHWSVFLQYLFGLQALGHDIFWLERLVRSGNPALDRKLIRLFLKRFYHYGFGSRCALLLVDTESGDISLESAEVYGASKCHVSEAIRRADLMWNLCCTFRPPFLNLFKHRALIDLDPGMLQIPALDCGYSLSDHETLLTIGSKIGDPDCPVPTAGRLWHRFMPFVYLPLWRALPDPGKEAPFSSITQWTWDEYWLEERLLSFSKRHAYLQYLEMPQKTGRVFELAANIHPRDTTGDRELMLKMDWRLANPNWVARSPAAYQNYIRQSRAEFCCPKPFYKQFNTGWVSDRSVAYLASGRPVLAEDTGFSDHLPTGRGLLCFNNSAQAAAGVAEIDRNYPVHMRAARELAEEYFNSEKWLPFMLSACGW